MELEFRWLQVHSARPTPIHPAAIHVTGTALRLVLQVRDTSEPAEGDPPHDWIDIPIVADMGAEAPPSQEG